MERCDFSSVMTIVRRFISDDYDTNQTALLEDVKESNLLMMKEVADRFGAAKLGLVYTGAEKEALVYPNKGNDYI